MTWPIYHRTYVRPEAWTRSKPLNTGIPERAEDLRSQASAIRDDVAAQELDLQARHEENERRADEAAKLEAQARDLDVEQKRLEKALELRGQAEAADAAAGDVDEHVRQLHIEMLEAAIRAARFEEQLAGELAARRQELEERSAAAAEKGDATAVLEAERDLALLPTLETRLREQAEAAAVRAAELNAEAAAIEPDASEKRQAAARLRRWAEVDALAPAEPPAAADELPELAERAGLTRSLGMPCRQLVLDATRQRPGLHEQNPATAARAFEKELAAVRAARVAEAHARSVTELEAVSTLVERVRDAAVAEASPWNGALVWVDTRPTSIGKPRFFTKLRGELERAIGGYRASSSGELPASSRLATSPRILIAQDAVDAATQAVDELARERAALDATLEAHTPHAG